MLSVANMDSLGDAALPDAGSPDLHLSHPTDLENISIWKLSSNAWKDALSIPQYLEESAYLMTVPLAKDGGMTQWVLVDKTLRPNQRPLLASCETFRKRSLVSDAKGNITETVTHGIASVYCDPRYRGRGYASRLMKELSKVLPHWQLKSSTKCVASVLFSDIGKKFYAALGWRPFPSHHIEFDAGVAEGPTTTATSILAYQLGRLCEADEAMCRKAMARPSKNENVRFMILPDHEHMLWHHRKEEYVSQKLFGRQPVVKGALAGQPGNRVWAVWTHRFYGSPYEESSDNTLYILRLVIENQAILGRQPYRESGENTSRCAPVEELKDVLLAAQAEATEWGLQHVKLWDPSPQVEELIKQTGIRHRQENRNEEGIRCLQWYGEGHGKENSLDWIGKEKYSWC